MSETVKVRNLRELDALVAEKVMGGQADGPSYFVSDGQRLHAATPARVGRPRLPAVSRSIAAAWTVVERMRAEVVGYSVELSADHPAGEWSAVFGMSDAHHRSAPVAICIAALRAKGVEVELPSPASTGSLDGTTEGAEGG